MNHKKADISAFFFIYNFLSDMAAKVKIVYIQEKSKCKSLNISYLQFSEKKI